MTLRRLKLMADGKREHDYDVAIAHASYISAVFNGKFDPKKANPIRNQDELEVIETDGKEGFALLGAGLRLVAGV